MTRRKYISLLSLVLLVILVAISLIKDGTVFTLRSAVAIAVGWLAGTLVLVWLTGRLTNFEDKG